MIIGVGIDIVDNKRIKLSDNFINKVLSEKEKNYYQNIINKKNRREFLAGRWAAKEALIKASKKMLFLTKIDIIPDKENKLVVKINGDTCSNILVTLSHEKKTTIAVAIIQ